MDTIYAISLYQPYASLCAWELKRYETRSWGTAYRGPLVIHASKNKEELVQLAGLLGIGGNETARFYGEIIRQAALKYGYKRLDDFPLGAGLCVCDLTACIQMTAPFIEAQTKEERAVGYWSVGRFAWKLDNVRPFPQPIPARGMQKLWPWTLPLPETERR